MPNAAPVDAFAYPRDVLERISTHPARRMRVAAGSVEEERVSAEAKSVD
jgi:hypothetical protein